jgi:betaine-aldehyde dehydrogenase
MAGNSIVIKTADQTPVATLALGHLLKQCLPDGLVNIVSGGVTPGDRLVTHPKVKRLAFIGSEKTALAIQKRLPASGVVKHFTAELGGKNPFIIFEDSDLQAAAEAAFQGLSFTVSAGQSCQSTAKILVQESVRDEVIKSLTQRMQDLSLGAAYDKATEMGPIVSASQTDRILKFIESGTDQGATLITGGTRLNRDGYFIEPTLFSEVTPEMTIYKEEIFGPVATVTSFKDEDSAIKLANDTRYGLSAAIWTNDLNRALIVSSQIDAGYIWVNDANRHYPGTPFGGMKSSGVGREEAIDEFFSYTESKAVNIKVSQ